MYRPIMSKPFAALQSWEVMFSLEETETLHDGSFIVTYSKKAVSVNASDRALAIEEAQKLVMQWKHCVTGVRKLK